MKTHRGFTLIEMIVAIALTGIVALLAYGSMQAGLDSASRIERYRRGNESEVLMRSLVTDALRHPSDAPGGSASFEIVNVPGTQGASGDMLRFVSRGVSGALGAGDLWRVQLGQSSRGLQFGATSLDGDAAPIAGAIPSIKSMSVRVLGSTSDVAWRSGWESTRQFPAAVEISFRDSLGALAGPPRVVGTGLESR